VVDLLFRGIRDEEIFVLLFFLRRADGHTARRKCCYRGFGGLILNFFKLGTASSCCFLTRRLRVEFFWAGSSIATTGLSHVVSRNRSEVADSAETVKIVLNFFSLSASAGRSGA